MRTLVGCASALMKVPISVERTLKSDEVPLKLGKIVRSVRARFMSGDLNRPLTVGYIDDEIPKLEFFVNGSGNYVKYSFVNVKSVVENVISEGDLGTGEVHGSDLAYDMQYRRGIKRSITDRMNALKLTDDPLEESLGKLENPNQTALCKRFEDMALVLGPSETSCEKSSDLKITLNTLEKLEKVDKPSLVVDQVGNTQPTQVAEPGNESFTLGKEFRKEVDDTDNTNIRDHFLGTTEEPRKVKLGWEVGAVINEKEAEQELLRELKKKLTLMYSSWTKYRKEIWGECDVLVISTPPIGSVDTSHPSISSSFYRWLLGHEFPNTTAVFMDHTIDFVCPSECFARLCSLGTTITNAVRVSVSITQKVKADAELKLVDVALYALRKHQVSHQPAIIGYIDGEYLKSNFLDSCGTKLDDQKFQAVNVISALVKLINEEDESKLLERQCSDMAEVELEQLAENYQQMCLLNDNNAKSASLISTELQNDECLKENYEHMVVIQKGEETKRVLEEVDNKLPTQFAQVNISVDDMFPPIEDNRVVVEGKSSNAEQGVQPEKEREYCRSNEDDDWEVIEKQHDRQEPVIANNSSWTRWMCKVFSSAAQGRLS